MKLDELVYEVVKALVDREDDVRVDAEQVGLEMVLHVSAAPEDVGKLIGKQGRTARALRLVLSAAAMKAGVHCSLNIVESVPAVAHG